MRLIINTLINQIKSKGKISTEFVVDDVFIKISIVNTDEPLVFTFSNAAEITKKQDLLNLDYAPWGFEFIKKRGHNIIAFSAFELESWYRSPKFHYYLENIFSQISLLFPYRFSYGSSMGGYGASAFTDVLNVDKLLLINPITTLNKEIVPFETRFKYGGTLDWTGKYSDGAVTKAPGYVVYDSLYHVDTMHANRYSNLKKLKFFGVGHAMPAHLKSIGILSELFDRFISDNLTDEWFYKSVRKRREYSRYYNWMMSSQNTHLTNYRKSIIKNYYLAFQLKELEKKSINNKQIDLIRDSALKVEKYNLSYALSLMELASEFRPSGRGIIKKIDEYKYKLNQQNDL